MSHIDLTNPEWLIGAVVVLLALVAILVFLGNRRRKNTDVLRRRFGAEYEYALRTHGLRKGEARLTNRVKRVHAYKIHDLAPTERERFLAEWKVCLAHFVSYPRGAVTEADELVNAILLARGFPAVSFEERAEDLSVDHARLVDSYRSANAIAARAVRNDASTEELRTAMLHYRSLFDELLHTTSQPEAQETSAKPQLRRIA